MFDRIREMLQSRAASPWLQYDFLYRLLGYEKKQQEILEVLHGMSLSTIRKRRDEFRKEKQLPMEDVQEKITGRKNIVELDKKIY